MLVRLELSNFKSYRGHQTIGPFKPFSAIIGPNGSGKSNLMDAISFVLGIKSSQLRSKQLKDLVYRGRKLAKGPQDESTQSGATQQEEEDSDEDDEGEGTAKTAWVMAVYEDEEGQEYRFQRTVSITGSSDYKINGRTVTYAVYNSALEKHNILVKAKNFLVFQGDVEAIARQSPKDLCRLIEQISGSLELAPAYEKAKEAQDKATANSTENMQNKREIAKEFKAYKEHKSEATKLGKLRKEKDDLVVQQVLWRLYHIQEGISTASEDIKAKNKELAKLRKEHVSHEKKVSTARKAQVALQADISKQEKVIKNKEKAADQLAPKLVAVETQIAHSEKKATTAESLGEKVQRDVTRQTESLESLRADLKKVEKLAKEAEEAQRKSAQQAGKALSDADIAEYRQLKAKANTLLPAERQKLDLLRRQEKTLDEETTNLAEKLDGLKRQTSKLRNEIVDLEEKKEATEAKVKSLQADRSRSKQELDSLVAERSRISQLETETNEKLQNCYTKIVQAGADRKQTEKETKLRETLATLKTIFPGVHGRVVDLCKPTQTKYQTAVSVVLGRNIDAIVIDHEKTAIECINYLRSQRLGQATFIPLDSIQAKPTNDKYRSFAKGARLAIDVIDFNPQFEAAMQHACGNSLVCDSMDIARYVCYEKGQDVKSVTLDGTVIHKSGSITGGQSSHGNGRKWDEKEVAALSKQRDSLMAYMKELQKSYPKGKTDENLTGDISRFDAELVLVKDDLSATKLRLTGLKEELKHAEKEIKTTNSNLDKKQASLTSIEKEISTLAQQVDGSEDGIFADFCARIQVANIRDYEEVQLRVAQQQAEARVQFDAQIARLSHQSAFEAEQLEGTQRRLQNLQKSAQDERAALVQLVASRAALVEQIEAALAELKDLKETLQVTQTEAETSQQTLEEVKKASAKSTKVLDRALKEIGSWNDTIERLGVERAVIYRRCKFEDIDIPLLSGSLDAVPMDAGDEDGNGPAVMDVDEDDDGTQKPLVAKDYAIEVDFADLEDDERENGGEEYGEELENAISKIDAEIVRMAPNMKAADKMGGVQAKLTETEREVEKARKESSTAREHFNDIKKQRSDLFNKAYSHISDRIDQVYKDLTKGNASPMGGVAYLSLEDSEEPYLAGIKYHAMPPMKRFRDMDQLSGGEQTVAALALLFAIHSFQPAPFFVLDEVDAALDNTNVARVARYLREHCSTAVQFIVISLKDTLYEKSNSLVGVYRDQDIGSSRSLTLDLTKYE